MKNWNKHWFHNKSVGMKNNEKKWNKELFIIITDAYEHKKKK